MEHNDINMDNKYLQQTYLLLLATVALTLVFFQSFGFLGTDDSVLTSQAVRVLTEGLYIPESHYDSRLGLILPTALVYLLFGIGEWQSAVFPALSFIVLPISVFFLVLQMKIPSNYAFFAALLSVFIPINVSFATSLYPEIPLAALIGCSLILFLKSVEPSSNNKYWKLALAFFGLMFWAYLIKIEVVFVLGAVGIFCVFERKYWHALFMFSLPFLFMLTEDILFYWGESTQIFNRLAILSSNKAASVKSLSHGGTQLWVFPKSMFLTPYSFGLLFYFVIAGIGLYLINGFKKKEQAIPYIGLIILVFAVFFLWLQFGSSPKQLLRFITTGVLKTKSHLDRYLVMLTPLSAVIVTYLAYQRGWVVGRRPALPLALLMLSCVAFLPFNDISKEYVLAYKGAKEALNNKQLIKGNVVYCDRATCTYFQKLQDLGEYTDYTFTNIVKYDSKTGKTQPEQTFTDGGGYVLINKNRYKYYSRRYLIKYPTLQSLEQNGQKVVLSQNPGGPFAYLYLNIIKTAANLIPVEHYFIHKIRKTVDESLDEEDMLLFYVSANNSNKMEYLK